MADILTPEQVAKFRRWADMGSLVAAYALRGALAEALDSHETLCERLNEANAFLSESASERELALRAQLAKARADRDYWKDIAQKSRPHLEMPDEVFDEYVRADY